MRSLNPKQIEENYRLLQKEFSSFSWTTSSGMVSSGEIYSVFDGVQLNSGCTARIAEVLYSGGKLWEINLGKEAKKKCMSTTVDAENAVEAFKQFMRQVFTLTEWFQTLD